MSPFVNCRRPTRRDLLRAAGGAAALFPFLGARAHAALPPTPRLVLLMQSNGTSQGNFWPVPPVPAAPAATAADRLRSPILEPLVSLPGIGEATTVIKGLANLHGGAGNGHDQGFAGLYSGWKSHGLFHDPWGSGISIDQHLAQLLPMREPIPTLNCGVLASDTPPFKAHRRSFSYRASRQQLPTEIDPYRLYARFFSVGAAAGDSVDFVTAAKRRLARRQSVLDYVRADLAGLRPRLPNSERQRLGHHEDAVRSLERRLTATLSPNPDRPPRCGGVVAPADVTAGLDLREEANVPALIPLMFDFLALALSCQLTRIVTFQFGHGGEKWYFRWLGLDQNSHDDIAHRDNGDPTVTAKLLRINRWYAEQVGYLARAFAAMPDGEGTLLDNSLIVWGNELATGPHAMNDLPVVAIGGAAGRLPGGGRLVDAGPQDYHRLGCSLHNIMGVPATGFGEVPDCGPIVGLH